MKHVRQYWLAFMLMLTAAHPRPGTGAEVAVRLFQFEPRSVEVAVGAPITWTNADDIEHTVTTGDGEQADGRVNGVMATKGSRFSVTFDRPGVYTYFCDRHHFMRGEIRVTPGKAGT